MNDDIQDEVRLPDGSLYLFEHAGARFVSGLFWQVLSKPREALQEAKGLGESMNFDFMRMREAGAVIQAGFASRAEGGVDDMVSTAAVIASSVEAAETSDAPQNWLAAVALPSGDFAYVAVRDGAFLPDGDVAGSKDFVIERLANDYGLGDWDLVIAPHDFGFPDSVVRDFESFLTLDKKGKYKAPAVALVQTVKKRIPWKQIVIGGVSLLLVGGAVQFGLGYMESQAAAERENAMRMQEARMAEEIRQKALATPPWAQTADTMDMLRKCEQAIFKVPFNPAAWNIQDMLCSQDGTVMATYVRGTDGAPTFDLKRELGSTARIDWAGEKATITEKITFEKAGREPLWFADEAEFELVGRFQQLGVKVRVREESTVVGPGGPNAAARPAGPLRFKQLDFTAVTSVKPSVYERAFTVPGVRIKRVKVTPIGEWTTEGEIYVEPPK